MALEAFIDIRFGDPVISIDMNAEELVYGSMMGRVLYYSFRNHSEKVIIDISTEYIPGVWLSDLRTLYVCIGDVRCLKVTNLETEDPSKSYFQFEKVHTSVSCELSQVKLYKNSVLLASLDPGSPNDTLVQSTSPVHQYDLPTRSLKTFQGIRFSLHCVFFDFDGKNLLYLEYESDRRVLRIFSMKKGLKQVKIMQKSFGKLGFCKLVKRKVLYVHNQHTIKIMNKRGNDKKVLGRHENYIVALNYVKIDRNLFNQRKLNSGEVTEDKVDFELKSRSASQQFLVLSVDYRGHIRIWDDSTLAEEILISSLENLTEKYRKFQYFSMGYPYFITASGGRLAITTDIGVLLIRSKYLTSLTNRSNNS